MTEQYNVRGKRQSGEPIEDTVTHVDPIRPGQAIQLYRERFVVERVQSSTSPHGLPTIWLGQVPEPSLAEIARLGGGHQIGITGEDASPSGNSDDDPD